MYTKNNQNLHFKTTVNVLFKAGFSNLEGSGKVELVDGDKTGIVLQVDALDLSNLKSKPFEPRLPLPEDIGNELTISAIRNVFMFYIISIA